MRSRSLLIPSLVLAALAPWPALAGETVPTTDPLTQIARIETEVKAAQQAGDAGRLAELREELRQLPVPASAAVRASRLWAMTRPGRGSVTSLDDPPDDGTGTGGGKTPGSAWTVEVSLDDPPDDGSTGSGGKTTGSAWAVEVFLDDDIPTGTGGSGGKGAGSAWDVDVLLDEPVQTGPSGSVGGEWPSGA